MTVSSNYDTITYIANGITTDFPWTYDYDATYGSLVVKNETDDITYVEGEDYTITNKTVIFNTAPADGKTIVLSRFTYRGQEVTFIEGEDFPAKDYETSLDRLFMIEQEQDKGLADETAARIAADIVLQNNIDAEAATRAAADITLQGNIDAEEAARIAADNEIRGLINATKNQAIYSREATYVGSDMAEIDVSDVVENGVAYVPIVTTAVTPANKEARKTLNSICWYYKSQKKVQLLFTDSTYQSTNNIHYGVTLIPTKQSYTGDGTKGITDGLDNLSGSGGGADSAIHIEHMAATYVHTSTIDSAHIDVSSYVEEGKAYIPVIATEGVTSAGYFERISSLKGTCLYDIENESVSLYFTNNYHQQVAACFSVTLIPVDYHPSHPDNKLCDGVTDGAGGMQNAENLVTSISSSSTDTQYPSAKCVYDIVGDIETLINAL